MRLKWLEKARPEQLPPGGNWRLWLILAGRGFGKTRTGAEETAWRAMCGPIRFAIVAPTFQDARNTCVEGESGLLSVLEPAGLVSKWNRSNGEIELTSGAKGQIFAAEEPNRLRGPQFHWAWCDELSSWRYDDAWDQLMFGLRLGSDPRVMVTTTPKPNPLTKRLLCEAGTVITTGSTFDNAANLAPSALAALKSRYEGTRLGRQELYAHMLDDTPGALWTRGMIAAAAGIIPDTFKRVVVAVDPSGSDGERGDSQGIVVAGLGHDGRAYVLEDASLRASPSEWGARAVLAYAQHKADRIVAEANYGGAMVQAVIQTHGPNLPVKLVNASRGKIVRAEPVAALYEQGRVTHVRGLTDLEDQMCQMTGDGYAGEGSPDRVDALVWALTDLMLGYPPASSRIGPLRI
jgi:predicted phage terminase large subunit-like protein